MVQQTQTIKVAVSLMRIALALLDRAQEGVAAVHLQHALDLATNQPPMKLGDEIDDELIERILAPS